MIIFSDSSLARVQSGKTNEATDSGTGCGSGSSGVMHGVQRRYHREQKPQTVQREVREEPLYVVDGLLVTVAAVQRVAFVDNQVLHLDREDGLVPRSLDERCRHADQEHGFTVAKGVVLRQKCRLDPSLRNPYVPQETRTKIFDKGVVPVFSGVLQ